MESILSYQAMHSSTVALREMMMHPGTKSSWQEGDTCFLGGQALSNDGRKDLCFFAIEKNYHLIYAVLDPAAPSAVPSSFEVFLTDGHQETVALMHGRLWSERGGKRPVIVFPDHIASIGSGHRLCLRERQRPYSDAGFEFAGVAFLQNAGKTAPGIVTFADTRSILCVADNPMFAM